VEHHPVAVSATGGKLFFDDDQEFPDTMHVSYDYAPAGTGGRRRQLVYEHRIWSPYVQEGHENGNAFYGTKGMLVLGKANGWKLFGPRNELKDEMAGRPDTAAHQRNFLDCIRSGARPAADIEVGHLSAALAHLGNIAVRTGSQLRFDPAAETIVGDTEAAALVRRTYRDGHWATPKDA
jgi:predicted dehydrogenase